MLYQGNPYTLPTPASQLPARSTTGAGLAVTRLARGIVVLVLVLLITPLRLWPDLIGPACATDAVICGYIALARERVGPGRGWRWPRWSPAKSLSA